MKEIIYLDTDIMNSMLAQLDEGLVNSFSSEEASQNSETEGQQSNRGKNAGLRGRLSVNTGFLPGGSVSLDGSVGNSGNESTHQSRTILEGQKDVLNKAFHDYALEVLTEKLLVKDLLNHGLDLMEGDIFLGEASYRFYDFNLIKKAMDHKFMGKLLLMDIEKLDLSLSEARKILTKPNPNAKEREKLSSASDVVNAHESATPVIEIFEKLNILSSFASNLLEDLAVIKTDRNIGLLKKKYLRESSEALSFRTDNSREVKYLMRVIGKKEEIYSGENLPIFQENDLDIIPNMMLDLILSSFKIVNKGDLIVTPIAIYYE
ncbi:hypothetical protein [Bacillus sp. ISL-37]|uniref:DUF6414 family protein n=1 Tax=Bacillus sp. ISL-37 TaxID=2819123 RepID=UPI001BEB1AC8|nr:hypothetical protein [Bacillus sp. ISL-37]MBT2682239.1 hypothetical protein [Bacillus sp. ISL-37]